MEFLIRSICALSPEGAAEIKKHLLSFSKEKEWAYNLAPFYTNMNRMLNCYDPTYTNKPDFDCTLFDYLLKEKKLVKKDCCRAILSGTGEDKEEHMRQILTNLSNKITYCLLANYKFNHFKTYEHNEATHKYLAIAGYIG